jgi:Domain of unknown function (DUF4260)
MKIILKLEEAAITVIAVYFLSIYSPGLPAWAWVFIFFLPDISMLGYLAGTKTGAFCYNLFHHKGVALAFAAAGYLLHYNMVTAGGILFFAHASFDRILGYGLKYTDSFKNTHLGSLEKK